MTAADKYAAALRRQITERAVAAERVKFVGAALAATAARTAAGITWDHYVAAGRSPMRTVERNTP